MASPCSRCWAHRAVPSCLINRAFVWSSLDGLVKVVRMLGVTSEPMLWTCCPPSISQWWFPWLSCFPSGQSDTSDIPSTQAPALWKKPGQGTPECWDFTVRKCTWSVGPQACHIEHASVLLNISLPDPHWELETKMPIGAVREFSHSFAQKMNYITHCILGRKLWLDCGTNKLRVMSNKYGEMFWCCWNREAQVGRAGLTDVPSPERWICFAQYRGCSMLLQLWPARLRDGENLIKNEYIIAFVLPLLCIFIPLCTWEYLTCAWRCQLWWVMLLLPKRE